MARFVSGQETKEIAAEWWDEGEVVTIRRLSFLDRRAINGEATSYRAADEEGNRVVEVDLEALDRALLRRGIVAWTLKGEDGGVAPLTEGMIERLSFEDGEYIVEQINEYNPRRTAAEQAGFRGGTGDGAAG